MKRIDFLGLIAAAAMMLAAPVSVFADVDLTVSASAITVLVTPVRSQTVTVKATNLGVSAVSNVLVQTVVSVPDDQLEMIVDRPDRCNASVTSSAGVSSLSWQIGLLVPGSISQCDIRFRGRATTSRSDTTVSLRISAPGNVDPNVANDFARTLIQHSALDRPADIGLSAAPSVIFLERENSYATVSLQLRNLGPSTPDAVVAMHDYYGIVPSPSLNFLGFDLAASPETPACNFFRDGEGAAVFSVQIEPPTAIAPGQMAVCKMIVYRLPQAPAQSVLQMHVVGAGPGVYDDINAQDNVVSVPVIFGATNPVAVPVKPQALILLGLLMMLGTFVARRNSLLR